MIPPPGELAPPSPGSGPADHGRAPSNHSWSTAHALPRKPAHCPLLTPECSNADHACLTVTVRVTAATIGLGTSLTKAPLPGRYGGCKGQSAASYTSAGTLPARGFALDIPRFQRLDDVTSPRRCSGVYSRVEVVRVSSRREATSRLIRGQCSRSFQCRQAFRSRYIRPPLPAGPPLMANASSSGRSGVR